MIDGDGTIDITEFIGSLEDYETMEELVEEKIFPSPWQKRMMSKSWNDAVWPILHVAFGIMVALFIANGMFGFVDGTGGNVAYIPNDSGLIPKVEHCQKVTSTRATKNSKWTVDVRTH